ncbi:MAG TPA: TIGR00341 family protein, partial [Flavobacteriales bacterium]|nr:TIGR00341 family protein [Flavobacteriales bacterium]
RGYVVWILICSIFIASIGLNLNSTAVIIGAMLISPLMAPILAIGLSVGTNDWDTLKRALKNFGVMVVVALMTSTLYFLITPLQEAQPELLARTSPTFLDALIAIFGGLAGIIGISRRSRGNVIPGVAIATALMPPLCTAGYGLANGQWSFFFGAFYLFTLNSIFIAGATFIIVRYLKFPLVSFVNSDTEKKVKRYMLAFVILVI